MIELKFMIGLLMAFSVAMVILITGGVIYLRYKHMMKFHKEIYGSGDPQSGNRPYDATL